MVTLVRYAAVIDAVAPLCRHASVGASPLWATQSPDPVVVVVPHSAAEEFVAAGGLGGSYKDPPAMARDTDAAVVAWVARRTQVLVLTSDDDTYRQYGASGESGWQPLRAFGKAVAASLSGVVLQHHPGWFNNNLNADTETRKLALALGRARLVVVSGEYSGCWKVRSCGWNPPVWGLLRMG